MKNKALTITILQTIITSAVLSSQMSIQQPQIVYNPNDISEEQQNANDIQSSSLQVPKIKINSEKQNSDEENVPPVENEQERRQRIFDSMQSSRKKNQELVKKQTLLRNMEKAKKNDTREMLKLTNSDLLQKAYDKPITKRLRGEIKRLARKLWSLKQMDVDINYEEFKETDEFEAEFERIARLEDVHKKVLESRSGFAGSILGFLCSCLFYTSKFNSVDEALQQYKRENHRIVKGVEMVTSLGGSVGLCYVIGNLCYGFITGGVSTAWQLAALGVSTVCGWLGTQGINYGVSKVADIFCGDGGVIENIKETVKQTYEYAKKEWSETNTLGKTGMVASTLSTGFSSITTGLAFGGGVVGGVAGMVVAFTGGGIYAFCRGNTKAGGLGLGVLPSCGITAGVMGVVGYASYMMYNRKKDDKDSDNGKKKWSSDKKVSEDESLW